MTTAGPAETPGSTGARRLRRDDWLTVNVGTPDPDPAARRPVMVWIYGGAYKLGQADSPGCDAQHIARDGDGVVVTFNYRVGTEGFTRIEGAPANRGLLDQVAALEWVRDSIAAFGGDPSTVTVFGESAGVGSVAALPAMPSARGLFHRAIAQSAVGGYCSEELARDIATAIAAQAGLRPTAADLSTVDPLKLTKEGAALSDEAADHAAHWGRLAPFVPLSPFAPSVDGELLPTTPFQAPAAGTSRDAELIAGHNAQEYRLFFLPPGLLGKTTDAQGTALPRLLGLAVAHAVPAPGRGTSPGRRPGVRLRADLADAREGRCLRRLPRPGRPAAVRHVRGRLRASAARRRGGHARGDGAVVRLPYGVDGVREDGRPGPAGVRHTTAAGAGTRREAGVRQYPEEVSRELWPGHGFPPLPLLG
ncbi:carboxylesterase family protein [Streptomyces sp. NPDC059441]|uniref:carboxylesterase family protein n=1 Tax=Streptomyces sp. NPDC059441 TaxID=3346829 RepID=UPI0036BA888A